MSKIEYADGPIQEFCTEEELEFIAKMAERMKDLVVSNKMLYLRPHDDVVILLAVGIPPEGRDAGFNTVRDWITRVHTVKSDTPSPEAADEN